jgi:hypothetical protein
VEEATAIALSDRDSLSDAISINCKALGITNIRIIRKIRSVSSELLRILSANDKAIQAHAIDSVSLLVWSVLRGEGAPSIQHLRSLTRYSFMSGKQAPSDQEAAWNSLLAAYGFAGLEEIDRLILEGIESGFFDPRPLQAEGAQLDATQAASRSAAEFRATWRTLWDSFDGAADRVLPHVVKSFYDHIQYLGPSDLNAVVGVLKELGWATDARKLIDSYVSTRGDDRDSLRLDAVPQPVDPDVAAALSRRVASIKDTRKLGEILLGISNKSGFSPEEIRALASYSVDEYVMTFRELKGKPLRDALSSAIQFDRMSGATEDMKSVAVLAKQALLRLGRESPLNAMRVRPYVSGA